MIENANPNSIGIRKTGILVLGEVLSMISLITKKLQIDAVDAYVLICVAYHTAMVGDLSKYDFDFENDLVDHANFTHGIVPTETIYLTLGMPRETVRKRLVYLASRGFIKKAKKGYVWVHEYGDDDKSVIFRDHIVGMIERNWDRQAISQAYTNRNNEIDVTYRRRQYHTA